MVARHSLSLSNRMVEKDFRWRGTQMTRAEAFSDAVIAFAVTLLVVALEVPHSFADLMQAVRGFGGFAVCFSLLVLVWSKHTDYFRRYGLQTTWSIFLNCTLLFLVLFYVYPLKFLFGLLFGMMLHGHVPEITQAEVPRLMVLYGLGFAAIFLVLALMYVHAFRLRRELELNVVEEHITRREIINHAAMVCFGVGSAGLAAILPARISGIAGWLFAGIGIYHWIACSIMGKKQRILCEKMQRDASAAAV
jgi:Endosomal/lysosomal potassium channel TMEM175